MVTKAVNRVDLKGDILLPSSLPIVVSGSRMLMRTKGSFIITLWSVRLAEQRGSQNGDLRIRLYLGFSQCLINLQSLLVEVRSRQYWVLHSVGSRYPCFKTALGFHGEGVNISALIQPYLTRGRRLKQIHRRHPHHEGASHNELNPPPWFSYLSSAHILIVASQKYNSGALGARSASHTLHKLGRVAIIGPAMVIQVIIAGILQEKVSMGSASGTRRSTSHRHQLPNAYNAHVISSIMGRKLT